jgi:hypothetical protein
MADAVIPKPRDGVRRFLPDAVSHPRHRVPTCFFWLGRLNSEGAEPPRRRLS